MLFNSYVFLFLFLPSVIIGFYALNKLKISQACLAWLLINSLMFYGWKDPFNIILIAASILFNYFLSKLFKFSGHDYFIKNILMLGIFLNLFILGYFKYKKFLIQNINNLLNLNLTFIDHELPLGISFFTFLQIAYLIDSYKSKNNEKNLINYSLFVTYFPHLIAGPIVHHKALLQQFNDSRIFKFRSENFSTGITIFILGLSKKVLLADNISRYASPVFQAVSQGELLSFLDAWGGALAYTLQIYFDFSGYSDMAVGLSKMFNIWLPENFSSPYKSTNIIDFWRRWHITLSHFLRDYLYIPLGGSHKGELRRYINLMITMFLGGLWHGAGWTFVAWGVLHGLYLMLNHAWVTLCQLNNRIRDLSSKMAWVLFARFITFGAVVIGWVFFRSTTINGAISMLQSMFNFHSLGWFNFSYGKLSIFQFTKPMHYINSIEGWLWIFSLLAIAWFAPNTQQLTHPFYCSQNIDSLKSTKEFSFSIIWSITISILTILCVINLSKASEFLYFAF